MKNKILLTTVAGLTATTTLASNIAPAFAEETTTQQASIETNSNQNETVALEQQITDASKEVTQKQEAVTQQETAVQEAQSAVDAT